MTSKTHTQSKPPTQKHCHYHHLYPRRPKPLYSPLPSNTIRVVRIIPGTRRGEYTAQMLEMPLINVAGEVTAEIEYDVLRLSCDPEVKDIATKDSVGVKGTDMDTSTVTATTTAISTATKPASDISKDPARSQSQPPTTQGQTQQSFFSPTRPSIPNTGTIATATATTPPPSTPQFHTSHDQEKSFFPILSLGGGEHVIEIPLVVKKAFETVVMQRWDALHSDARYPTPRSPDRFHDHGFDQITGEEQGAATTTTTTTFLATTAKPRFHHEDDPNPIPAHAIDQTPHEERRDEGIEQSDDDDDDSIIGSGEDFYLWIPAVCIDHADAEDRRQQGQLWGRIEGMARRILLG